MRQHGLDTILTGKIVARQTFLSLSLVGFGRIIQGSWPTWLTQFKPYIWRTGWFARRAGASLTLALSHTFFTRVTSEGEGVASKCWSWWRRLCFRPGVEELELFVHASGMLHSSVKDRCGSVGLCLPLLGTSKANPSSAKPFYSSRGNVLGRGGCCCLAICCPVA